MYDTFVYHIYQDDHNRNTFYITGRYLQPYL